MSFIAWNDRLLIGVPAIDQDHQRLIRIVNELYDTIARGDGRAAVGGLLEQLEQYTQEHFHREESLFAPTSYPHAAAHRREHDWMRKHMADMRRSWREGTLGAPSLQLMTVLKDWLFDHILGRDQQIVPYLAAPSPPEIAQR